MKSLVLFLSIFILLACKKNAAIPVQVTKPPVSVDSRSSSYLALGDSYTIGESVAQNMSFPFQLSASLKASGIDPGTPTIVARTGWTTGELQSAIKSSGITSKFDIVTLLIGVNNQFRGNSIDIYRKEFKELLQTAIDFAGGKKDHVFVVSIPDWGATPYGLQSGRGQQNIAREIDAFNAVNKEETIAAGVSYTDITPDSRLAATDLSLVAADGLHPSGKMYQNWVSHLAPSILKNLK